MARKRPVWLRWLMLAVAAGILWTIRDEFGTYTVLAERPIFSPEETAAITADYRFSWAVRGLVVALFLYQVFLWDRRETAPKSQLCDGVALSLLTLVWGALWLCLTPSGPSLVIWAALLLALAGSALWSWRKFYLLHQSSTEHEEESQHER